MDGYDIIEFIFSNEHHDPNGFHLSYSNNGVVYAESQNEFRLQNEGNPALNSSFDDFTVSNLVTEGATAWMLNQANQSQMAQRETSQDFPATRSSEVKSEGAATSMLNQSSQNQLAVAGVAQHTQAGASSGISTLMHNPTNHYPLDRPGKSPPSNMYDCPNDAKRRNIEPKPDQKERKRMTDKAYRDRIKEERIQMEFDLQQSRQENESLKSKNESLMRENALLNEKLHSAEIEAKQLKSENCILRHNVDSQENVMDYSLQRRKVVVLKLDLHDDKTKVKAVTTVTCLSGVDSVSMEMTEKKLKLTLKGSMDPVHVAIELRKFCQTELIYVGPAKEPEKKEEAPEKAEGKKCTKRGVTELVQAYKACNPHMTTFCYVRSAEEYHYVNSYKN